MTLPASRSGLALPASLTPPPLRDLDGLPADAPPAPLGTRWYRSGILRLVYFVLLMIAAALVTVLALAAAGAPLDNDPARAAIQIVAAVAAYAVLTMVIERRRPPYELAPRRWPGLLYGLAAGAAAFLLCFVLIAALGGYRFDGVDAAYSWLVPVLVVGASAGIGEEIMLRGVLFRLLEAHLGTWIAAALSGLVFGLMHLGNQDATLAGALAIAVEAGLMFALLYALTRSLWVCIGVHAAWNIVQGPVLGVPVSGSGFNDGWLSTVQVGPDWLTGGSFGAEASPVTVAVMVLLTGWLARELARSGQVVAPSWTRRARLRRRAAEAAAVEAPPAQG